jgi:hypothetical protein
MCPNCEKVKNILSYKHFERPAKYQDQLNVVLKCRCGHVFSPGLTDEELGTSMKAVAARETANV